VFVDAELRARGGVHAEVVALRAMRVLAQRAAQRGWTIPWEGGLTVDELAVRLWQAADLPSISLTADDLASGEGELQRHVVGADPQETAEEWRALGRRTVWDFGPRSIPVTRLQDAVKAGHEQRERLAAALAEQATTIESLRDELDRVETIRVRDVEELRGEVERVEGERAREVAGLSAALAEARARIEELNEQVSTLEQTFGVRVTRKVRGVIKR
jgi:hypothetical protein